MLVGPVAGAEKLPVETLLEVFSSRRKQLRAADRNPNPGADPAQRNGAEAEPGGAFVCFCWNLCDIRAAGYLQ